MGFLIDSTVLIHAERHGLTPDELVADILERVGDVELAVSVMSAGELFHGCWRADSAARRARRESFVETLVSALPVVDITLTVMRIFGEIDARLRAAGTRLPTSDLLIACTALLRGDGILTGNPRHFRQVPGLEIHELA